MKNLIWLIVIILAVVLGTLLADKITFNKIKERKTMQTQFQGNDGNLYIAIPNGTGGVNYFRINSGIGDASYQQPIPREIFASQTGADVGAIEHEAAQGDSSQPANTGGTTPTNNPPAGNTGSGSGGTLPTQDFYNPITGKTTRYNLNDPSQAGAFYADKLSALQGVRDQAVASGKQSSDKQIADLNTQLNDTFTGAKTYVDTYLKNVNEFGDQYQLGNVKRAQFFAGLSPNAFQSSQGSSAQFAENKYIQGLGDYVKEAHQNVGDAFLASAQSGNVDNSTIDPNSVYGRNINAIKGSQQDVAQQFNNYKTAQDQNVMTQATNTSNSLGTVNPYTGQTAAPSITAANTTDVSGITPYTTFQQGNVQVPVGQTAPTVYNNTPINTQQPLDAFLGTNKLSKQGQDYLVKYLKQ